jgi:hypothetical protein
MNENRYLTEEESYDKMLFLYKDYLNMSRRFEIENIALKIILNTPDIGVLMLLVREKNKEDLTRFNYNFIK